MYVYIPKVVSLIFVAILRKVPFKTYGNCIFQKAFKLHEDARRLIKDEEDKFAL